MWKSILLWIALGVMLLTGCSFNQTIEDEVSATLGDMVEIEKVFEDRQNELKEIEEAEQKMFFETMTLTQEQTDKVIEHVIMLKESLEERFIKIEEEAEAMQQANALVAELSELEEKAIDNERVAIEKIKDAANSRYQMHSTFVENYQQLTNLQKALYEMLIEDNIDAKKLDEQVEAVNKQNQKVMRAVEDFNRATIELNQTREEVINLLKK